MGDDENAVLQDVKIGVDWLTAFFRKEVVQFMAETTAKLGGIMGAVEDLTNSLNAIGASTKAISEDVSKVLANQEKLADALQRLADKGSATKAELDALAKQAAGIAGELAAVEASADKAANVAHPSHGLPGGGHVSGQPVPGGGRPDQGLPSSPGHPEQGLPSGPGHPDHDLPGTPQPKKR